MNRKESAAARASFAGWGLAVLVGLWPAAVLAQHITTPDESSVGQTPSIPAVRLTLDDAVARSLTHYPGLRAARASRDQARASVAGAHAPRLPSVAFTASATQFGQPMLVRPLSGFSPGASPPFDQTLMQGAATASYTLFDGGARGARIARVEAQASVVDADVAASEQTLMARVATSYVQLLASEQVREAHEQRITAVQAELQRARQRLAVGRAPRVEVLRAEAAMAAANAERIRVLEAITLGERDLSLLTGVAAAEIRATQLEPVHLVEGIEASQAVVLTRAIASSPTIVRAKHRLEMADADAEVARSARWPSVHLTATGYQRAGGSTAPRGDWSAATVLSVPLFTGGATSAEIRRADAAQREGRELMAQAQLTLEQEMDRARSAEAEARARSASLRIAVEGLQEVARIQRLALDTGTGTQVDFLNAEAELLTARASLAEASMRAVIARVELARATGTLTRDWITRTLMATP